MKSSVFEVDFPVRYLKIGYQTFGKGGIFPYRSASQHWLGAPTAIEMNDQHDQSDNDRSMNVVHYGHSKTTVLRRLLPPSCPTTCTVTMVTMTDKTIYLQARVVNAAVFQMNVTGQAPLVDGFRWGVFSRSSSLPLVAT